MTMRIYVGTYAKYNRDSIQGAWLDLEDYSDKGEFEDACKALHPDETDPEFMFQAHEGIPEGMVSESHVDADVWDLVDLTDYELEMFKAYRSDVNQSGTLEEAQDAYCGHADSETDYAHEYVNDAGLLDSMPVELRGYFDFEAYGRDLFMSGYTMAEGGHVFRDC